MSASLPPRPDLAQLRRLAKELRTAARAGHLAALARTRAHLPVGPLTLTAAQLVIAREHGFASWPRLKAHVEASTAELARQVDDFLDASVTGRRARAAALLAREPSIARHSFRTAVVLGDAARVRELLASDPAAATRPDPRSGRWPLLDACASVWSAIDPDRVDGLVQVARLLLDGGADPDPPVDDWTVLDFAVVNNNLALVRLLLQRGTRPQPRHYCHAATDYRRDCLRLLLDHTGLPAGSVALYQPISDGSTEMVRMLLDAGVDPNQLLPGSVFREPSPDEDYDEDACFAAMEATYPPVHPLTAALLSHAPTDLIVLLLDHGARDSAAATLARRYGRADVAELMDRSPNGRWQPLDVDSPKPR